MTFLTLFAVVVAACDEEQAVRPVTTEAEPAPPPIKDPDWRAVIDDWYDNGRFDEQHECAAVREMAERLPTGGRDYSSVHDDFERYADLVCADAGQPSAPVTITHRFVHPLPYPAGPHYLVSVRPAGQPRGVRWARFSNDPSYTRSGQAGEASISVLLPARRYVVTSSTRLCTDPADGCGQMGKPQARCSRSVEVTGSGRIAIKVVARSGLVCEISVDR